MRWSFSSMVRKVGNSKLLTILCILVGIQIFKIITDWKLIGDIDDAELRGSSSSQVSDDDLDFERVLTGAALDESGKYYVHRFYAVGVFVRNFWSGNFFPDEAQFSNFQNPKIFLKTPAPRKVKVSA